MEQAAERINEWHEDHPKRVRLTASILASFVGRPKRNEGPDPALQEAGPMPVPNQLLQRLHRNVFPDRSDKGTWRTVQNRVGLHAPPPPRDVAKFMEELENETRIENTDALIDWYFDLMTIHPFLDGNGRVGGIVVAAYSHILHPVAGWLSANQ